jgi:hypothetical protein
MVHSRSERAIGTRWLSVGQPFDLSVQRDLIRLPSHYPYGMCLVSQGLPDETSMQEPKGIFSAIAQPIGEEMVQHLNAPPLRQNQDRAVWGIALLTGGAYVAYTFMVIERAGFWEAERLYLRALHAPWENCWPFYLWGGAMLFGLLWVMVGVRGSRAPRQIMTGFWAMAWTVFGGAALWYGWYIDEYPVVNWFLKGLYLMIVTGAAMLCWLAMRGTGPGAVRLIQQQIARQAKVFRLGRKRSF